MQQSELCDVGESSECVAARNRRSGRQGRAEALHARCNHDLSVPVLGAWVALDINKILWYILCSPSANLCFVDMCNLLLSISSFDGF